MTEHSGVDCGLYGMAIRLLTVAGAAYVSDETPRISRLTARLGKRAGTKTALV